MGHAVGGAFQLGPSLLAGGSGPSWLHRHFDLDRAGKRSGDLDADQSRSSATRQSKDSRVSPRSEESSRAKVTGVQTCALPIFGFTGTSIWIEPESEVAISMLTNRVHPRRDNQKIREFRPKIHDLIMDALDGG